jgi:alkylation response protein AidB-like acyl-CoA dehydrogenase
VKIELTPQQKSERAEFRDFVNRHVLPYADGYDREEHLPPQTIELAARGGYLAAFLPAEWGGRGMDMVTWGLLNEEFGRGCSSLRSLLTVHGMVSQTILKWGSKQQREAWLPGLSSGATLAAFGLTEPDTGSDAGGVESTAVLSGDSYILNGHKKWITFGQIAGLFLIFARSEGKLAAFLLTKDTPGLSVTPITGMLGVRASMLAGLKMNDCRVPRENLVGRLGFGLTHIASHALDYGRYSVATGSVGIAQGCLEACLRYAGERKQFGAYLKDHQLIQRMLTDMITNIDAARLLCYQAGYLKDTGDPRAIIETSIAKYFASTTARKVADDAVQIHGANGCSGDYPVQRYLRDAKIMEIIEGSTQIQQITIAKYAQSYLE